MITDSTCRRGAVCALSAAAAAVAVRFALAQIGTPYLWGGEGPGGFDCSGLVQAAYQSAGISLPRVAQQQYDVGPRLQPGQALEPGDLVFFGADTGHVPQTSDPEGFAAALNPFAEAAFAATPQSPEP